MGRLINFLIPVKEYMNVIRHFKRAPLLVTSKKDEEIAYIQTEKSKNDDSIKMAKEM